MKAMLCREYGPPESLVLDELPASSRVPARWWCASEWPR
jgi:hypothetical protein